MTNSSRIEGWLLKKKSNSLFGGENYRWFRIQEVKGVDQSELALCYYASQREKEAKGWVFIKDITKVIDNIKTFSVVTQARVLVLEAKTSGEHMLWLQELCTLCPHADTSTVRSLSRSRTQSRGDKEVDDHVPSQYGTST
ncbi:hypothetical protein EON65_55730, partial [archaeon]